MKGNSASITPEITASKLSNNKGLYARYILLDFWRINHWFEREDDVEKPRCVVSKKALAEYFNENIWVITPSNFFSATLNYCIDQLGAGRIMFSVNSPYEAYHDGCTWFDDYTQLGLGDKIKIG